ncbi:MAG: T9SS type A sorting domain-containing protein [bacterium]
MLLIQKKSSRSYFIPFLIGIIIYINIVFAQLKWLGIYGGEGNDDGYCVKQTYDNGYITVGSTTSFGNGTQVYLLKIDSLGDTIWTKTYGGADWDIGYCVQQTSDSGYIVVGTTTSFGENYQVYLIKTDSLGDTLWTRTYGGPSYEFGWAVQQTTDGGYIIAGTTQNGGVYLIKTDADGDSLWTKTYGGYEGWSVQQTSDNGYIVTGYKSNGVYLVKTDSLGDTLWTRWYMYGIDDVGKHVEQTIDGGYVIAGTCQLSMHIITMLTIKTDSAGNNPIFHCYGPGTLYSYSAGTCIKQTADSGYILVGFSDAFGNRTQVYLIKTDSLFEILWENVFGLGGEDLANSVQQTTDGGYIIAGYSSSFGNGVQVYLIKTDEYGIGGIKESLSHSYLIDTPYICVYPNPFNNHLTIGWQIGDRRKQIRDEPPSAICNPLSVKIYNATGRLVKSFNHLTNYQSTIIWDGDDDLGRRLPSGVYFVQLEAGDYWQTEKVILLK